ncbi:multiple epidermal growth factor-like domains protein 10, partial [Dinothrombium tinctorium]
AIASKGDNVCEKAKQYLKEVRVPILIPFEVQTFSWCLKPPSFRCLKTRYVHRNGYKMEARVFTKKEKVCCKGYIEIDERCIPICSNACIHGKCVAPEKCDCAPGWSGDTCNVPCLDGKWGEQCDNNCNCYHNSTCDKITGRCICAPGYTGSLCENSCTKNRFGKECAFVCGCLNGGECNFVTGECFCQPNYYGVKCEAYNCSKSNNCSLLEIQTEYEFYMKIDKEKSVDNMTRRNVIMMTLIFPIILIILMATAILLLKYKQKIYRMKLLLAFINDFSNEARKSKSNWAENAKQGAFFTKTSGIKQTNGSCNNQKAMLAIAEDFNFDSAFEKEAKLNTAKKSDDELKQSLSIEDLESMSYNEPFIYGVLKLKEKENCQI